MKLNVLDFLQCWESHLHFFAQNRYRLQPC